MGGHKEQLPSPRTVSSHAYKRETDGICACSHVRAKVVVLGISSFSTELANSDPMTESPKADSPNPERVRKRRCEGSWSNASNACAKRRAVLPRVLLERLVGHQLARSSNSLIRSRAPW